jgi:CDP-2,3-bis-(O-geranylgeranyl)-sn-glycerol synthase
MREIAEALYVFLPAGVANATPPLLTHWLGSGHPIDAGRRWHGNPLFGEHKTWEGLVGGTCAGVAAFAMQRAIDGLGVPWSFGIAISFGALAGDLVKSFAKRQLAIAPGRSWFPFDQLDYIAGALIAGWPFLRFPPIAIAAIAVTFFVLHLVVSAAGYAMGVKSAPI